MDVERFTAELPGLAAGRPTFFDELVRLAKPETELTVSYVMNRMESGLVGDPRGASIVLEAVLGVMA